MVEIKDFELEEVCGGRNEYVVKPKDGIDWKSWNPNFVIPDPDFYI